MLEEKLKQRLVGATVLIGLAVIFLPMLFDNTEPVDPNDGFSEIPPRENPEEAAPGNKGLFSIDPDGESSAREPVDGNGTVARIDNIWRSTNGQGGTPKPAGDPGSGVVPTGKDGWVVQLASFTRSQNARELETKLKGLGYRAFVETVSMEKGVRYRVRVGPEPLKDRARILLDRLKKESGLDGIVINHH